MLYRIYSILKDIARGPTFMAKKPVRKMAGKRADQYMLRFPEGMRENLAKLAASNGRSMNTEIIAALEKHLERDSDIKRLERKLGELWDSMLEIQRHIDPSQSRLAHLYPSPFVDP
jgi:hypothetical protein